MATKRKKDVIVRYRISSDKKNIIIDYADKTRKVLPYSRQAELEILEKYKSQILAKKKEYSNNTVCIVKNGRNILISTAVAVGVASLIPASYVVFASTIILGFTLPSMYRFANAVIKRQDLKKQIALADNVDKINESNENKMTDEDRSLGKEPELFNLSKHREYSKKEARDIIKEADGNYEDLIPLREKAYQKVKSKFKRC